MNINPIQPNQNFYANQAAFWQQDNTDVNNRLAHVQDSGEVGDRCGTCMNRRYMDVSDDAGVSFQTPTRLTPGQAATAVHAHEREHYMRNAEQARQEGREVIHNSIRVFSDVCPECGIQYISGGETKTVTRGTSEEEQNNHQDERGHGGFDIKL